MEIKIPQNKGEKLPTSRSGVIPTGATVISANLQKKSVVIDKDGNQIDLATKKIIKRKDE